MRATFKGALGIVVFSGGFEAPPSFAQSAAPEHGTQLPEVRVTSTRNRPRQRVAPAPAPAPTQTTAAPIPTPESGTGPVNGVLAHQSVTATKTDTPILETPQSISVITKDQVAEQGAQTVQESLRYSPGVALQGYGANAFFDGFKIRGFDAPRYLDGLRLPTDSTTFAIPKIEPYGLERIEVLKGPSSGLYGQSDPGGLLNMVSKRPTVTPHYDFETTFGNFNYEQGAFDIGGPIDKNGEFLYRIVGLGRLADTQTDFMQDNKLFIAPSFTWRPTTDTSFTILSQYQKIDNKGYQQYVPGQVSFLPNPNGPVPYSRYLGEPSVDGYKLEQSMIGYAFEHRFDNNIQFRQNMRYTKVTNDLQSTRSEGMDPVNPTQLVARSYNYVKAEAENVTLDNQLQADFRTGILTHKVLVGADYLHQTGSTDYRTQGSIIYFDPVFNPTSTFPSINAYNPRYGASIPPFASLPSFILSDNKIDQVGLYAQDQIKLDRWMLSLTGRQDFVNTELDAKGVYPLPGLYQRSDSAQTGRVGLSYLFDFGLAPYISYSTSFVPNTGGGPDLKPFKPTTGDGKEIGVKFQPLGMNLMVTAALFEINQDNVLTPDPTTFGLTSLQTDAARSRGFEIEARGNVTRELELIAGFTTIDPVVTKSSVPGKTGKYLQGVPLDQASMWAKYTWFDGGLAGFGIGAGVRYVGQSYGDDLNTFVIPSYTLFDASVSYDLAYWRPDLKGWKAQINATNLFDKYYTVSCLTGLPYCGLGTSRTVLGTLKYAWN
ncbi:TonB-dependent siderophore receptor [Bradyrhizobium sp. SYSU BS000235]|uniref:TonB-dependent siderophore receptor n=1 Tax=Bradyrhizobium sp. SYSU BS000235 TaxID=3411332 RepID=UPI003C7316AE